MRASEIIDAATHLAWPILIGFILWKLLPEIKSIAGTRGFAIKVGGAEINVQQASEQLSDRLEEVREQVSALKQQVSAIAGSGDAGTSPIVSGLPQLNRVLWVDDFPENNAYEMAALERKDVKVDSVKSTGEALAKIDRAKQPYDAIISDMGRQEDEGESEAGLALVDALHEIEVTAPIFIYASAPAIRRTCDKIEERRALGIDVHATSSATELLEMLGRVGQRG
jgi:CheY-like chemotaxis protein